MIIQKNKLKAGDVIRIVNVSLGVLNIPEINKNINTSLESGNYKYVIQSNDKLVLKVIPLSNVLEFGLIIDLTNGGDVLVTDINGLALNDSDQLDVDLVELSKLLSEVVGYVIPSIFNTNVEGLL